MKSIIILLLLLLCIYSTAQELRSYAVLNQTSGWYSANSELHIQVSPDTFSKFSYWDIDGQTNISTSLSIIVTAPMSITANVTLIRTSQNVPNLWFHLINSNWTNNFELLGNDDSDYDGFNNTAEYISGTNPLDSDCYPRISRITRENDGIRIHWKQYLIPNQTINIDILKSNDMHVWNSLSVINPVNGTNSFWLKMLYQKEFYRISYK